MGNVRLENLTKEFGNETAVKDINLDVRDGEFITLVGPSGCGKSTTLEMVAGLTSPTEGKVYIDDEDVTNLPPKNRRIAMVFQNIALFPHMDVRENVSFGLRLRDFDDEEMDRRIERALDTVRMNGMQDRMPDELSGGQRQRVAIARAIVREPSVFLMDEPLANLDAELRVHMRTQLQRLHNQLDTTIIYVTHDQEEAMTMSNRLAVMNDGQVMQFDTPLTCYNQPANRFVAGFIGSPSMNFIDAEVTEDALATQFFDLEVDPVTADLDPGQEVVVGVRPEDVAFPENKGELEDPSDAKTAYIDVVEPVGDEIFLYLQLEDGESNVKLDSAGEESQLLISAPPNPDRDLETARDSEVKIHLDLARIHLFDADTGDAIAHGLTEAIETSTVTEAEESTANESTANESAANN